MESDLIKIETHKVPQLDNRIRLSDYAPGIFKSIFSKKGIKKVIKKGLITIDGDLGYTSDYIVGGETITLFQSKTPLTRPTINIPLEVVYEDEHLSIINKPAGIVVSGNKKYTLENALPNTLKKSTESDALERPEPIHRLDYPTSGAILIGKTSQSVILLNKMFEDRKINKTYHAVTVGLLKDKGIIELPIDDKSCITDYRIISKLTSRKYEALNLVELNLHTGRRHQIRIHLSALGSPVFGDLKYGKEGKSGKGSGLYLHASSLVFSHPITKDLVSISIPLPKKFLKLFPKGLIKSNKQ